MGDITLNAIPNRAHRAACTALALACLTVPHPALARTNISTDSAVFVERARAENVRHLEPASALRRGDRVVTIVSWYRLGGNGGFVITNPMPRAIAYQQSASSNEEVSADGGRTWGRLGALTIGQRTATPVDVTHVRWRISPNSAAGGTGHIDYSGIDR